MPEGGRQELRSHGGWPIASRPRIWPISNPRHENCNVNGTSSYRPWFWPPFVSGARQHAIFLNSRLMTTERVWLNGLITMCGVLIEVAHNTQERLRSRAELIPLGEDWKVIRRARRRPKRPVYQVISSHLSGVLRLGSSMAKVTTQHCAREARWIACRLHRACWPCSSRRQGHDVVRYVARRRIIAFECGVKDRHGTFTVPY